MDQRPLHGGYPEPAAERRAIPPIAGYRQLNQTEFDQINGFKVLGTELELALKAVAASNQRAIEAANEAFAALCDEHAQREATAAGFPPRWDALDPALRKAYDAANESNRCLGLAKTSLQQGLMWAVRGVAKPEGF